MQAPTKILVLSGHSPIYMQAVDALRKTAEVVETPGIEQAVSLLRSDQFAAIFTDAGDYLPLERALVSQQASLILNTIGEGVCIVDGQGHANWMNKRLQAWPTRLHDEIRRNCIDAFAQFQALSANAPGENPATLFRNRRFAINLDEKSFW